MLAVSGKVLPSICIPNNLVGVKVFGLPMPVEIDFAFEELTATTENRVIADMSQVVSQVIDAIQSVVAVPTGEGRNHFAGEWVVEARNGW